MTDNFNNLPAGNSDAGAAPSSTNAMATSTNLAANAAGFTAFAGGTSANCAFYSTSGSPTPINGGAAAPNPKGSFGHQATTTPNSVADAYSNQTYYERFDPRCSGTESRVPLAACPPVSAAARSTATQDTGGQAASGTQTRL